MQIEFRADGARISGYVNAVERQSRPVMTPMGRVVEEIEAGAFARALERRGTSPPRWTTTRRGCAPAQGRAPWSCGRTPSACTPS